jgi:hypothetical protein
VAEDDPIPQADALEQHEEPEREPDRPEWPDHLGDRPEADTLEQSMTVEEEQVLEPGQRRDDVPEADWLEQSIGEPVDEER